jgi:hypothetical protein
VPSTVRVVGKQPPAATSDPAEYTPHNRTAVTPSTVRVVGKQHPADYADRIAEDTVFLTSEYDSKRGLLLQSFLKKQKNMKKIHPHLTKKSGVL